MKGLRKRRLNRAGGRAGTMAEDCSSKGGGSRAAGRSKRGRPRKMKCTGSPRNKSQKAETRKERTLDEEEKDKKGGGSEMW